MYTYRINIFHIANSNACAVGITHYLIFNFFPTADASLNKDFTYPRKAESICKNGSALIRIISNASSGASQSISRTKYNRISYLFSKLDTIFDIFYHKRSRYRLSYLFHRVFEFLTVFSLTYSFSRSTYQFNPVFIKNSGLIQLHPQVQTGLSSQGGKE